MYQIFFLSDSEAAKHVHLGRILRIKCLMNVCLQKFNQILYSLKVEAAGGRHGAGERTDRRAVVVGVEIPVVGGADAAAFHFGLDLIH